MKREITIPILLLTVATFQNCKPINKGALPEATLKSASEPMSDAEFISIDFNSCHHDDGELHLFSPNILLFPAKWLAAKAPRRLIRPVSGSNQCHDQGGAYNPANNTCTDTYYYQFYPAHSTLMSRYIVRNTTLILRVLVNLADEESVIQACKFSNKTALIFVAGVGNPDIGSTLETTDFKLLDALVAWNRDPVLPWLNELNTINGNSKLSSLPAYIQIVANKNAKIAGPVASHSGEDIEQFAANLELAYRSGVTHLEVISHSNGMVTSHMGFRMFAEKLKDNYQTWGAERNNVNGSLAKMAINFYHLQAAPARAADTLGGILGLESDFIPVDLPGKEQGAGIHFYLTDLDPYIDVHFRFFYNSADWLTYGMDEEGAMTTVGQRISMIWHRSIQSISELQSIAGNNIKHYSCRKDEDDGACGPGHNMLAALWAFVTPGHERSPSILIWEQRQPFEYRASFGLVNPPELKIIATCFMGSCLKQEPPCQDINCATEINNFTCPYDNRITCSASRDGSCRIVVNIPSAGVDKGTCTYYEQKTIGPKTIESRQCQDQSCQDSTYNFNFE